MIEWDKINKLYFVGIGGIAMSAAANLARQADFEVSGSDSKEIYDPAKSVLDSNKIDYFVGYSEEHVKNSDADVFIFSAGEDLENPEVKYVVEKNLPHIGFPQLLQYLAQDELRLVVAGTHGKSTTTGLLGHLLKNLDNSSFFAGGVLQNYNSNFYKGQGHYFVLEGDEYKTEFDDPTPKFHYYKPDILVLTNLEYDHPDQFSNIEDLANEFNHLIENMPEDGLIIYNADSHILNELVHRTNVSAVSFGVDNPADFRAEDIEYGPEFTKVDVSNKFSKNVSAHLIGATEEYKTQLPGKINVYNALAAIATLRALGFQQDQIALDLLTYKGIKRRFEIVGKKNGILIVDDYAHHPTAVRETLEAARTKYKGTRIWAIFEPHTFSRTQATIDDLAKSFNAADEVLISEIYPAREKKSEHTITSYDIVSRLTGSKRVSDKSADYKTPAVRLIHAKQEAIDILKAEAKPGDVIIVMAVGGFNRLAYELKETL